MSECGAKVYAIDFDGVLCRNAWPEIGEPNEAAISRCKALKAAGHKLILWTCREGDSLREAIWWCAVRELYFDAVNENLSARIAQYGNDCRKIGADFYIDDRAEHWPEIEPQEITRSGLLDEARRLVCGNRDLQYGPPEASFSAIASLWTAYLDKPVTAHDVGMLMALFKIARVKTGQKKPDNYVDLCGYGACAGEIAAQAETKGD